MSLFFMGKTNTELEFLYIVTSRLKSCLTKTLKCGFKMYLLGSKVYLPEYEVSVYSSWNIYLSSEIKPVVVRSCSIRQKVLDLVILNSQRGNFLPMNCYSFGKHSAPIALRWGWKNTKAFTIGWSHFRSSILTLDSGIDVPPGINVAPRS